MRRNSWLLLLLLPLLLTLAVGLGYAVLSIPEPTTGLQTMVLDRLAESGVSNPVTAVLLNFRGYDTLLEMVVLLLALLGVWSLGGWSSGVWSPGVWSQGIKPQTGKFIDSESAAQQLSNPVQNTLTGLLVPVLILVAAYLLWVGAHAPGGAFQAGSVLGAAGVLLILTGRRLPARLRARLAALPLRLVLVAGPGAFVVMALLTLLLQGQLLTYPPAQAGLLILILETAATLSIGVTLAALFAGCYPGNTTGNTAENTAKNNTEDKPKKLSHNRQNK